MTAGRRIPVAAWRRTIPAPVWWLAALSAVVQIALLASRGRYTGTDESMYLLLGHNLWRGAGYTLNGLPHLTFSPLFPVLAGALARVLGDWIWAGRLVAVAASAGLVLPCWIVVRRSAGPRVAWIACALTVAWPLAQAWTLMGREMYQGASEPLAIGLLWAALALPARTWRGVGLRALCLVLAMLARPEAAFAITVLGVATVWTAAQRPAGSSAGSSAGSWAGSWGRALGLGLLYTAVIVAGIGPRVVRRHGLTGQWSLSGRSVPRLAAVLHSAASAAPPSAVAAEATTTTNLLWGGSEYAFIKDNYSIAPNGVALTTEFFGAYPRRGPPQPPVARWDSLPAPSSVRAQAAAAARGSRSTPPVGRLAQVLATVAVLAPWPLWIVGLFGWGRLARRRAPRGPAPRDPGLGWLTGIVWGTSVVIVAMVHVDPRNHLGLVPWLLVGVAAALAAIPRRLRVGRLPVARWGRLTCYVAGALTSLTLATRSTLVPTAQRQASLVNQAVATDLQQVVPADAPLMSWAPALAVLAQRDWRVLPYEPADVVRRYAAANGHPWIVWSVIYPTPLDWYSAGPLARVPAIVLPPTDTTAWATGPRTAAELVAVRPLEALTVVRVVPQAPAAPRAR